MSLSPYPVPEDELRSVDLSALAEGGLHELFAACETDGAAPGALALMMAQEPKTSTGKVGDRLWVRHQVQAREVGLPSPVGLAELGIGPARMLLFRAPDVAGALQAGLEGARCPALGTIIIELRGEAKSYDLTASRRLALAARETGVSVLLARTAVSPTPSAAQTRWLVRALPSRALAAKAPGLPAFELSLLRARNGQEGLRYCLEWDRDARQFIPVLSLPSYPLVTRMPSRRYLALWCPVLSTDKALRKRGAAPDNPPFVLVEKVKGALIVAALNAGAAGLGLRLGMTLAQARARVPQIAAGEADAHAASRPPDARAGRCLPLHGLDRRTALWAVRRLPEDDPLPLFAAIDAQELGDEPDAKLPEIALGEHVATDYQTMRLSLKAHPMALLRPLFQCEGVCCAAEVATRAEGRFTRMAGLVLVRQRPGKGNAIFMMLEDETGITNCVLWARQFEALRRPVMAARLMLVEGRVQHSAEGVVHLMISSVIDRSEALDHLWAADGSGLSLAPTWRAPADEAATLGEPGNVRDPRHAVLPPPRHRHPRDARILPRSRDFH